LGVRRIEILGFGIGAGDPDQLQEAEAVRIVVAALARHQLPIAVAHLRGVLGAVVAQMAEAVVEADHVLGRRGDAGARNPDGWMRLLDRPRPEIDHAELIVLAVPGEYLLRRPGLGYGPRGRAVGVALLAGDDAVGQGGVAWRPGREAAPQPPAADAVEHPVFLGDARRRRGRWQGR